MAKEPKKTTPREATFPLPAPSRMPQSPYPEVTNQNAFRYSPLKLSTPEEAVFPDDQGLRSDELELAVRNARLKIESSYLEAKLLHTADIKKLEAQAAKNLEVSLEEIRLNFELNAKSSCEDTKHFSENLRSVISEQKMNAAFSIIPLIGLLVLFFGRAIS